MHPTKNKPRTKSPYSAPTPPSPGPSPQVISRDLSLLHSAFLAQLSQVISALNEEGYPMRVFEAYRSPGRQQYLYSQGRNGKEGKIVTNARPWTSYHQYGLAADFAFYQNGIWSWDAPTPVSPVDSTRARYAVDPWVRLSQLAIQFGLETIQEEQSHVQLSGYDINQLQQGKLPGSGGDKWWGNLTSQARNWTGSPSAPKL